MQADLTEANEDPLRFYCSGEDENGIVESFNILVSESKMKIGGRDLEVIHFEKPT
jgi:glycine cleavage system regulatory protein